MSEAKRARRSPAEKETDIRQAVAVSFARDAFQANLLCEHAASVATQLLPAAGDEAATDPTRIHYAIAYLRHQQEILFGQRVRRAAACLVLGDGATRIASIASPSERNVTQLVYELLAQAPAHASLLVAWLLLHGLWTRTTWLPMLAGKTTRTALMAALTEAVLANTNVQFQAQAQTIAGAANPFAACTALTCASHAPAPV